MQVLVRCVPIDVYDYFCLMFFKTQEMRLRSGQVGTSGEVGLSSLGNAKQGPKQG